MSNMIGPLTRTGWVWLQGCIVGTAAHHSTEYSWDGEWYRTREHACRAGLRAGGHDDFNVAHIENGTLTWFGWMGKRHPTEDYAAVAEQFGWDVVEAPEPAGHAKR